MSLDDSNTRLAAFTDQEACLWDFTVSHRRLVIRLGWEECIFLLLEDVRGIWGPTWWEKSHLRVTLGPDQMIVVEDSGAGFSARGTRIELSESDPSEGFFDAPKMS